MPYLWESDKSEYAYATLTFTTGHESPNKNGTTYNDDSLLRLGCTPARQLARGSSLVDPEAAFFMSARLLPTQESRTAGFLHWVESAKHIRTAKRVVLRCCVGANFTISRQLRA
jgi:hypothetical protein